MAVANSGQHMRFRNSSTSDMVFRFILLDVLFFPYPPGLPITFGVIAAIVWPILSLRHVNKRYFIFMISLIALTVISFMRFLAFSGHFSSIYFFSNFVNAGIICFMAVITLMITSNKNNLSFWLKNNDFCLSSMKIYILFKSVLSIVFFLSPSQYFSLRSFWTLSGNAIEVGDLNTHTRFTGTLSDPNNFACIMVAVVAFVIFRQSEKIIQNIGILLLACPAIAASMSVTGIFASTLVIIMYALNARLPGSMGTRFALKVGLIFSFLFLFFVIFLLVQDNTVIQLALQRVAEGSTESRLVKFEILADLTHAVFLAPIFLGFSLNVGIYEPRFAGIWAILIGLYFIEPRSMVSSPPLMVGRMQPADSPLSGRLV